MTPLQTITLAGIWCTPTRAEGGRLHAVLGGVWLCQTLSLVKDLYTHQPALSEAEANVSGAYHPGVVAGCGIGIYLVAEQGDHAQEFITAAYRASSWSLAA